MAEVKRAKIAYLLLVHNKPEQLNMYIGQLLSIGNCDIYIHVSRKSPFMMEKLVNHPNVHIFSEYEVRWASYEIVASCIFLMKQIVKSGKKYDFVHFGSGQDLVIKEGLLTYLAANPNKLFIRINGVVDNNNVSSPLYRVKWPRFLMVRDDWHPYRFIRVIISRLCLKGINLRKNPCNLPDGWKVYGGRTWFTFPFHVVKHILEFLDETPEYMDFWYNSLVPDLLFFQTIIMNSRFKGDIADELTYVQFGDKLGNWNHPVVINSSDIGHLEHSEKYFARKFDDAEDINVIKYFCKKVTENI